MKDLLGFLALALVHGTLAAAVVWGLEPLSRTRLSPAWSGALWTLALAKFCLPFGLARSLAIPPLPSPADLVLRPPLVFPGPGAAVSAASPGLPWPALLGCAWLVAIAVLVVRRLTAARRLRRAIDALPLASPALLEAVRAAAARLGLQTLPAVRVGLGTFIAGLWRPTLVVPFTRCETDADRAVLLHELAHLRRGDPWVRALQNLVQLAFFFWPPVRWINRKIELYRELACDQLALEHGPLSPAAYARVLLEARRGAAGGPWRLALLEMSSPSSALERRIELLLHLDRPRPAGWAVLAVACGAGLLLSGAAFAVEAGGAPSKGPTDAAVVVKKLVLESQPRLDACYVAANAGTVEPHSTFSGPSPAEWKPSTTVEKQGAAPLAASVERFGGTLVLSWTIAPDGAVTQVRTTSAALTPRPPLEREEELGRCLADVVRGWTFPKATGGVAATGSYPFTFASGC